MREYGDNFGPETRIFGEPDDCSEQEIVDKAADWMSHGAEYHIEEAKAEYGEWLVEALNEDERFTYHEGYKTWARADL